MPGGPLGALMCAAYLPLAGGFREACPTKPVGLLLGDAGEQVGAEDYCSGQRRRAVALRRGR